MLVSILSFREGGNPVLKYFTRNENRFPIAAYIKIV